MSFSDDFAQCMSPLPTPGQILDSADQIVEFLDQLHTAWESAGGDMEMTLGALAALGAATGLDESVVAILATAGEVLVSAYIGDCVRCLTSAAASSVWDLISSNDTQPWLQDQLTAEADRRGIQNPAALA